MSDILPDHATPSEQFPAPCFQQPDCLKNQMTRAEGWHRSKQTERPAEEFYLMIKGRR
jgi:hypothetical protein